MAIFRGTGGSGNSTDDSIVSAVTEQAGIATTKAGEAATSASTATTKASEASASATTATTKATEASASATTASTKATEANTAKTGAEAAQTAAETARDTAQTHANTANNSSVQTVAGISTEVQNVNNIRTEIQNVDTIKTDVTTVAGISSNVTTVAADASDIGTVATNITNVNNVGDNIANVNAVHSNASNINTVAADGTDIGTVSSNISNVNTVAGISSDVTTVAGLESKMDTVIADASDIGAVAGNIGDVTTVAGINSEVDTVAGISAKVTTVADNITDVQNADTNAANASASASQAANSASAAGASATTASTKATEASNSATAASNSATTATTKATEAAGSATTATTKATEASTSATNAATSATTATTKASEAASSATAASGSATTATTKASEASVSAASAATSATDASNAENAWSSFYATYLGSYSAPPTVDVQGNALQTGAFYYDTGTGSNTVGLYVYNGSSWVYSTNYNNVTAPYSLAQDLATNSHDISFGDNAKAKFGASNDLQIYHNGSDSYIRDVGTGNLNIDATNFNLRTGGGNEIYLSATTNGAVGLRYDNAEKLATTATGIDVTGTVTADGLTVDANTATFSAGTSGDMKLVLEADTDNNEEGDTPKIQFKMDGGNTFGHVGFVGTDGDLFTGSIANSLALGTDVNTRVQFYTFDVLRQQISNNGDISFYEDTGTTPKFFWDASAERLGIGTNTPSAEVHVHGASGNIVTSKVTNPEVEIRTTAYTNSHGEIRVATNHPLVFKTNGNNERMRIDSSGNVGIGTTNPAAVLDVECAGGSGGRVRFGGTTTSAYSTHINVTDNAMELWAQSNVRGITFSTGTSQTERMRIDSSGNVGIGTTSPASPLAVMGDTSADIPSAGSPSSHFAVGKNDQYGTMIGTLGSGLGYIQQQRFDANATTYDLAIQPNGGNVGIGTGSPTQALDVNGNVSIGTDSSAYIDLERSSANYIRANNSGTGRLHLTAGTDLRFHTGQADNDFTQNERMRIDSSGNLLVGKTSSGSTIEGAELHNSGSIFAVRDSNPAGAFDRKTTDGDVVQFRKDGTTVGSISTKGDDLTIQSSASNHKGLRFGNAYIAPTDNGGNIQDDATSLGTSSTRFKDLYLSGGVHLGGTTAANKLDDYEEGTFTPVMTGVSGWSGSSGVTGNYTKIGDTVHVFITMTSNVAITGTAGNTITGLPFSSNLNERCSNVSVSRMFGIDLTTTDYIAGVSGSEIFFSYVNGDNNVNNFTHSGSTLRITISATYKTAA